MSTQPISQIVTVKRRRRRRFGTTAIETAFVMPFFIFFLYMVLEVSHMLVVNAAVKNAARNAARFGTTSVSDTDSTKAQAVSYCTAVCPEDKIRVWIKDASSFDDGDTDLSDPYVRDSLPNMELMDAETNQLFMVQIKVSYDDIAFIPWPFTKNVEFEGRAFMRRE